MSPELGNSDHNSEVFFIRDANVLKSVLEENFVWIDYAIKKLQPQI